MPPFADRHPCRLRSPSLHIWYFAFLLLYGLCFSAKSPQVSDLRSQISGVEELLEEFRKQLQQDQQEEHRGSGRADVCLDSYTVMEGSIIRTKDSIALGATFLTAPAGISSWEECLHVCCSEPRCTLAVVEMSAADLSSSSSGLNCYLFNCTYRNRNVCKFSLHRGYSSFSLAYNGTLHPRNSYQPAAARGPSTADGDSMQDGDELPRCDAGQDVVLQLPTDWVILDGRDSMDDHGIVQYEWTLLQGDLSIDMKAPQPGMLKLSGLQEGVYVLQLTVTDTAGQKSSDNITVTVLPAEHKAADNTGRKSTTHAAVSNAAQDGAKGLMQGTGDVSPAEKPKTSVEKQLPLQTHGNDKFYTPITQGPKKLNTGHIPEFCLDPPAVGPCRGIFPRWYFDASTGTCMHFIYGGCKGNENNFLQEADCVNECIKKQESDSMKITEEPSNYSDSDTDNSSSGTAPESKKEQNVGISKANQTNGSHPIPESGAVLPLALGLAITALLLLMVACRLRLVRQKLKKARPITSEESDYLINGMYL